ncbi:GNAT family N-acetyltransferase [Jeotgalibacillus sp. S-D1]|uniref:GNAT family N-acetyltransferase n=1 Tax=Jeotgalibacillus sp. S-D1 TaxID=2552189 RepID=UPI00105964DB|nr:GNAT family N-acetyltransferase [Jeotgalibacillus sp. S-D1]TDL30888.1 GNAT family N-acetyltransferase [Jeotgalibacillus sp. S-D1]
MKIVQAGMKELEGASDLFNLYRIFYEQKSDIDGATAYLIERFKKQDSVIFVALHNDSYIGFMQLYPSFSSISMKRTWILNDLYVAEEVRGQGVAQGLMNRAIDLCQETGAISLSLQTAPSNTKAQRLYEKNQFIREDNLFFSYVLNF